MRNSRQIWEIGRIVSEGDLKFEIVGYIFADVEDMARGDVVVIQYENGGKVVGHLFRAS